MEHFGAAFLSRSDALIQAVAAYLQSPSSEMAGRLVIEMPAVGLRFRGGQETLINSFGPVSDFCGRTIGHVNSLRVKGLLGKGTFNNVWLADVNQCEVALKQGGLDLVEEAMMLITMTNPRVLECAHLFCAQELDIVGMDRFPVARPLFLVRNGGGEVLESPSLFLAMERMNMSLHDFLVNPPLDATDADFIDIMAQIFQGLAIMQHAFQFMHRDLHSSNVMLIRRPGALAVIVSRQMNGQYFQVRSRYQVAMVDLGQSCCSLSRCVGGLTLNNQVSSFEMFRKNSPCTNASLDLAVLVTSMHHEVPQFIARTHSSPELRSLWVGLTAGVSQMLSREDLVYPQNPSQRHFPLYYGKRLETLHAPSVTPVSMFHQLRVLTIKIYLAPLAASRMRLKREAVVDAQSRRDAAEMQLRLPTWALDSRGKLTSSG